MADIKEFEYGYDQEGLTKYIESIRSTALKKAQEAVLATNKIVSVCENEWEGKARENFVENLKKDAQHVSDQFEALYGILEQEVAQAQAAMANKDEELIQID